MYDFITGKFRGISAVEEASVDFGMDVKQVKKFVTKREEFYKKQSLKFARDIRFPSDKELKR
tara:strand:- start:161 stop:346 length:186 start_codon:yes stop_codon:yes gene_type:complete